MIERFRNSLSSQLQGEVAKQKTIVPIGNAQKNDNCLDHSQIRINVNKEITTQQAGKIPSREVGKLAIMQIAKSKEVTNWLVLVK